MSISILNFIECPPPLGSQSEGWHFLLIPRIRRDRKGCANIAHHDVTQMFGFQNRYSPPVPSPRFSTQDGCHKKVDQGEFLFRFPPFSATSSSLFEFLEIVLAYLEAFVTLKLNQNRAKIRYLCMPQQVM